MKKDFKCSRTWFATIKPGITGEESNLNSDLKTAPAASRPANNVEMPEAVAHKRGKCNHIYYKTKYKIFYSQFYKNLNKAV